MLKKVSRIRSQAVIWGLIFSFLFVFSSFAIASQDELDDVHKAIKAKGKKWFAGETSVSKMPHKDRIARLGAIIDPFRDDEKAAAVAPPGTYTQETSAPASFDWRNYNGYNYVTPIRDQGNCGSCWAFATAAAIESQTLIGDNTPGIDLNLAEQILLSCSSAGSCGGGYISSASNFIRDTGLPLETCYRYTAANGSCPSACLNWQDVTHQIVNWHYVATTSPTVDVIKSALNQFGPLVTTFQVYSDFYYYVGGVYSHTSGTYQGGHAVLIVGYDDIGQYFTVKNSWGTGWGEAGFFKIAYSELTTATNFGDYTIAYEGNQPPPAPVVSSITATAPNGGESWAAGTTQAIRWTYTGTPGTYVKIELFKASTLYMTIAASASIGSGGSGSYSWPIPSGQAPGTDYRVRVTSTSDSQYLDVSNSYFAITAPLPPVTPSIRVSAANGGESWQAGTTQTIRWMYEGTPGSYVKIELLKAGVLNSTITSGTTLGASGSGSYNWTIPSGQTPASDYQIQVTSTSNSSYNDKSDSAFTIAAPPSPAASIRVSYPNGGETLRMGSTPTIRWTYSGDPGASVKIELMKNGVLYRTISSSVSSGSSGNGSYNWTIPSDLEPSKKYKIRVTSTSNGSAADTSNRYFSIMK